MILTQEPKVPQAARALIVNDVHSKLNATAVRGVFRPETIAELQMALRSAREQKSGIALAGGRHAMGGQQFLHDRFMIDMSGLDRMLRFDAASGQVAVQGGMRWPKLIRELEQVQGGNNYWGITQKQTGADELSIGGAVSANIHGRGLKLRPFIQDLVSLDLLDAEGALRHCSREKNRELFELAAGGYGLFGVIYAATLQLQPRYRVERRVRVIAADELMTAFEERMREGCTYGDFQFAIDPADDDFLRRGVFSCYAPTQREEPSTQKALRPDDWERLLQLAHIDKKRAFDAYANYYLSTQGQVYWSDLHQMSWYPPDYHRALDERHGAGCRGSEMITELYVPRGALAEWLGSVRTLAHHGGWNIIYGTVRLIEKDGESFLAWARQPWACTVLNLCVEHTIAGIERAKAAFRALIDSALDHGGCYYLTYHKWARLDQALRAHPKLCEFLQRKRLFDPENAFSSNWHEHYRELFR